jgi:alkanesulfonate monooxygenase SsuD/methylene tetrahydromethanopterin reductase-like flavin-dependent oxidoreductase (luciferase family)
VRVGLQLDPGGDPAEVADEARRTEELGFDLLSAGEHVFFHGPVSNAFVTLAAAAVVTERVRLVSALTVLPLYPMVLAAKQAATVDRISHGRFELGLGLGGEYPKEFAASGVPVNGRGARVEESLPALLDLLAGKTVTASGAYGSLDCLRLDPPPVQPRVPVWMGGRRQAAMRRAGRFADIWLPYMMTPDSYARGLAAVTEAAGDAGRPSGAVSGGLYLWGSVDESAGRARREAVETVGWLYQQDFEPLADRYLLHGQPDAVAARIAEYAAAGARSLIFAPACPPERRAAVVALFAQAVLPFCRDLDQETPR